MVIIPVIVLPNKSSMKSNTMKSGARKFAKSSFLICPKLKNSPTSFSLSVALSISALERVKTKKKYAKLTFILMTRKLMIAQINEMRKQVKSLEISKAPPLSYSKALTL